MCNVQCEHNTFCTMLIIDKCIGIDVFHNSSFVYCSNPHSHLIFGVQTKTQQKQQCSLFHKYLRWFVGGCFFKYSRLANISTRAYTTLLPLIFIKCEWMSRCFHSYVKQISKTIQARNCSSWMLLHFTNRSMAKFEWHTIQISAMKLFQMMNVKDVDKYSWIKHLNRYNGEEPSFII